MFWHVLTREGDTATNTFELALHTFKGTLLFLVMFKMLSSNHSSITVIRTCNWILITERPMYFTYPKVSAFMATVLTFIGTFGTMIRLVGSKMASGNVFPTQILTRHFHILTLTVGMFLHITQLPNPLTTVFAVWAFGL